MLLANTDTGRRQPIKKRDKGFCPICGEKLTAKYGKIKVHHWAHRTKDCDSWAEGETYWHYTWKSDFGLENCERTIGEHRADIYIKGLVIEIQNSPMSTEDIEEREQYYKKMIWIFNGEKFIGNFYFHKKEGYHTFSWKWPRKTIASATVPFLIDFGFQDYMFCVKKIYTEGYCNGWGYWIHKEKFVDKVKETGSQFWSISKSRMSNQWFVSICECMDDKCLCTCGHSEWTGDQCEHCVGIRTEETLPFY